jgi:cytochrome c oxidase subunit 2
MTHRSSRFLRGVARLLPALPLLALAGCSAREFPQTIFEPHSDYAGWIQALNVQLIFWVTVIFVVVQGMLIIAAVRFRDRPGAPEPKPVHGNTALEIGWTLAPAIILAMVAVPTILTIFKSQAPAPAGAIKVQAIGHQWWWEFRYPDLGIVTASEMHIPVNRPVLVEIESADVIHSFWFPAIGGKRDAVPSRTNRMWFTADSVGTYPGQCAEFCGLSHANMRMKLMVDAGADYDAWVAHQKLAPAEPDSTSLAGRGRQIFSQAACVGCHTVDGVSAGIIGPNLTHVGSRTSLAGAIFPNDADHLGKWIQDAPGSKPGSLMPALPALGITPEQVPALVAFLQSLK